MSKTMISGQTQMVESKDEEVGFQNKHKGFVQIKKTMTFEAKKNKGKFLSLLVIVFGLYLLSMVMQNLQQDQGAPIPENPAEYFQSYLNLIDTIILIIAVSYAGSIIVEDFEQQTGNLLFPKITKDRLLFGRFLMRYLYAILNLMLFYVLVGVSTYRKYNEAIPIEAYQSFGWAVLYLFTLMCFSALFSSIMKKAATSIITTVLLVLLVFQLATMILAFTGSEVEPFFFITYYAKIITKSFAMPEERFIEASFGPGPGGPGETTVDTGNTYFTWTTPSYTGALVGMIVYSVICIGIAYYLFKKKQNQ